jgi:MFS superfamily sulfate permease-like transporter
MADLTVAVEAGMMLAMLMFIRKVSRTTTVDVAGAGDQESRLHALHDKQVPDYVTVFRAYGPPLFGGTERLLRISDQAQRLPPIPPMHRRTTRRSFASHRSRRFRTRAAVSRTPHVADLREITEAVP